MLGNCLRRGPEEEACGGRMPSEDLFGTFTRAGGVERARTSLKPKISDEVRANTARQPGG
jgi:hypothetical protein